MSVCADGWACRLGPHRRAAALHRLLQVVVVRQNLHEEVELQSLRLRDKNRRSAHVHTGNFRDNQECTADLRLLALHAPDAAGPVHHRVLRHHLARVDVAAGADDAATGQDHVSTKISWGLKEQCVKFERSVGI